MGNSSIGYTDVDNSINLLEKLIKSSDTDKIELSINDSKLVLEILKDYMNFLTT